ncbi:MAG: hypothetical protein N2747_09525 [Chitinophagaceae bacterium]|nr:hypothetical protein [Chitinophagaceae bacterium]
MPKFSDPDIQKMANDANDLVTNYMTAIKNKDMNKMTELANKWTEWANKTVEISTKPASKPEEAKAWSDFRMKLSEKWTEAAKQMAPAVK